MTAVDEFLAAFFGVGNLVLPDSDFASEAGLRLAPYLEPLRLGTRTPVVLPRRTGEQADAYVICWDHSQATSLRATIDAFVAHSYVPFDGRRRRLNPADPVEAAVLRLVGPDTTYVLRPPDGAHATRMWRALELMTTLVASRPVRVSAVPRPVGRMLAEFYAALASGNAAGSAEVLDELAGSGLSAVNLAYLRIHRLSRLGRDAELLQFPQLVDVVASNPPLLVRDAILAAWGRLRLLGLQMEDVEFVAQAADRIAHDDRSVVALARGPLKLLSADAIAAIAAVALVRGDPHLGRAVTESPDLPDVLRHQLIALIGDVDEPVAPTAPTTQVEPATPTTWVEWVARVAEFAPGDVAWAAWPPPSASDVALSISIDGLTDAEAHHAWNLVGPILEADELGRPAWRTAKALLVLAASYDRWAPADVSTVQALLEVFLRGAPPTEDYRDVLELFAASVGRWAVAGNALAVLDMVDDVAHAPSSDPNVRLGFTLAALQPLSRHRRRLTADLRWLGMQLSAELSTSLTWDLDIPETPESDESAHSLTRAKILIYSLDDGVLRRTADRLAILYPRAVIHLASNHVGTPQLRAHSRSADVIALATRCAKHAATGFIRDHAARDCVIIEADGAGSASLIRAATSGLSTLEQEAV